MSKVAEYLQGHILGEISVRSEVREQLSRDGSVLQLKPDMAAFPRTTNDIRKITRFAWQLAEKGHVLAVTARGGGTNKTGAAITKGISLVTPAHMNEIFEYEPKQKLVRLQPGVTVHALNQALRLHGAFIPVEPHLASQSTVGGAIANNSGGKYAGKYGQIRNYVKQLEVVLASGDVLQTGRISKRELNHRKGLQGFVGDVYRGIDAVIEDNKELINDQLSNDQLGDFGYALSEVKHKDGSFDLTPLFVGSQGTLGVISEMILQADFAPTATDTIVLSFGSKEVARDSLDALRAFDPGVLNYYDIDLFENAKLSGRTYKFLTKASENGMVSAVVVIELFDFNERARSKKIKKIAKLFQKTDDVTMDMSRDDDQGELETVSSVTHFNTQPSTGKAVAVPLADGIMIPPQRLEVFSETLDKLATKHHVKLPIYGRALDNVYFVRPQLDLKKVSDKQKVFKLLDELSQLTAAANGVFVAEEGEGRLKARFMARLVDDEINDMFASVKKVCDPHGFLNPGVKQPGELKELVGMLASDYQPHFSGSTDLSY